MSRSTLDYPLFSRSSRGSPAQPREAAQQLIPRNCPNSPLSNIRPTNPRLYTSASGSTTSHYLSPNNESLRFRSLLVQISLSFSPVFIYFFFARSINFGSRENRFRSLLHDNVLHDKYSYTWYIDRIYTWIFIYTWPLESRLRIETNTKKLVETCLLISSKEIAFFYYYCYLE